MSEADEPDVKRRAAALVHTTAGAGKFISLPVVEDEPDPAAPAAFEETEPQESQEDGVEYDERQIERLNAQLKGMEFVDDRVRWRVLKVSFDAEHEAPVCFYFDAKLGDEGTVDDCEYSGVDEVQQLRRTSPSGRLLRWPVLNRRGYSARWRPPVHGLRGSDGI